MIKNIQAFPYIDRYGAHHLGMTLRDYFAAHAMMGIQARYGHSEAHTAKWAYQMADEMLRERDPAAV